MKLAIWTAAVYFFLLNHNVAQAERLSGKQVACALIKGLSTLSSETLVPKDEKELPTAPFVLLGFFGQYDSKGSLKDFLLGRYAWKLEEVYRPRRVAHFYNFSEFGYKDSAARDNLEIVKGAVHRAVSKAQGKQIVFVVLDGFDAKEAFKKRGDEVTVTYGYLNLEINMILSSPKFFAATRWLRDGHELTPEEVAAEFGEFFPERFQKGES